MSLVPIALRREPERESPLMAPCHPLRYERVPSSVGPASTPSAHSECLSPDSSHLFSCFKTWLRVKGGAPPSSPTLWSGLGFPLRLPPLCHQAYWIVMGYLAVSRVNTLKNTACFVKKKKAKPSCFFVPSLVSDTLKVLKKDKWNIHGWEITFLSSSNQEDWSWVTKAFFLPTFLPVSIPASAQQPAATDEKHMVDLKEAAGMWLCVKYIHLPSHPTPHRMTVMTPHTCLSICVLLKCLCRHGLIRCEGL